MNGGDPVEESGQALRTGFVQAMQTAHTTQALFGRWGGEARTRAEHEQRLSTGVAKEERSMVEHRLRVDQQMEERWWDRQLNSARVEEVRARIQRGGELHDAEKRRVERQIERADKDLERRDQSENLDRGHKQTLHNHQITGYKNREQRAGELHDLEVEYKQLLVDIRRRAAGFTETLTEQTGPRSAATASSAAAFAAADATADLSGQNAGDASAYRQRFTEDTGIDPRVLMARAKNVTSGSSIPKNVSLRDIAGLATELSLAAHLVPLIADDPDRRPDLGQRIESAVEDSGLHEPIESVAGVEEDLDPIGSPTWMIEPEREL